MRAREISGARTGPRNTAKSINLLAGLILASAGIAAGTAVSSQEEGSGDLPRLVVQTSHSTIVSDFVYSRDSLLLATLGADGVVKIWNTATGKEIHTIAGYPFRGIAFHPNNIRLAAIDAEGIIWLFDVQSGGQLRRLEKKKKRSKGDAGGMGSFFMESCQRLKPHPLAPPRTGGYQILRVFA